MALTPFLGLDTGSLIDDPFLSPFSGSMSLFNPLRGASNMVRAVGEGGEGARRAEREGEGGRGSDAISSDTITQSRSQALQTRPLYVDVQERNDKFVMSCDVPDVRQEDVNLEVEVRRLCGS